MNEQILLVAMLTFLLSAFAYFFYVIGGDIEDYERKRNKFFPFLK